MTKYYLKFDTMKYIIQTPVNCSLEDALHVICRAEEIACNVYLTTCCYLLFFDKLMKK